LSLHQPRSGNDDRPAHAIGLAAALEHSSGGAKVFDAAVGAAADKDVLDRHLRHRRAGGEAHVIERFLRRDALALVGEVLGVRHRAADGDDVLGAGAPRDTGFDIGGVDGHGLGEHRALIGVQRAPVGNRPVPLGALGGHRTALEVGEGHIVGCDQPSARARLDAHVADGEAFFDRHRLEHLAAIFDHVTRSARRADGADDVENQVLGAHPRTKIAFHPHFHRLRLLEQQRLGRQHVLDLARPDTKGERAQPAVAGGVRIPAYDGGAGQREALFRPDHMDNPLFLRGCGDVTDAESRGVHFECCKLRGAFGIGDGDRRAVGIPSRGRWQVVVRYCEGQFGPAHRTSGHLQRLERLRAGHLVDKVAINIDERRPVVARLDNVRVPDLFVESAGAARHDACFLVGRKGCEPRLDIGCPFAQDVCVHRADFVMDLQAWPGITDNYVSDRISCRRLFAPDQGAAR